MFLRRAALPLCFTVVATLFASSVAACSSSKDEDPATTPAPGIDGGSPQSEAGTTADGGKEETEIVFDESTTFGKRACSLTLRYTGAGNEVKLAGEFTDWATAARPMTKTATGFELTLQPSANATTAFSGSPSFPAPVNTMSS